MIRHGFDRLGFEVIEASADAPNAASFRVMERAGMTFARRSRGAAGETRHYVIDRAGFDRAASGWPGPEPARR
jgi:RimJ/RimL family protein N-acetyltransferase